MTFRGWQEADAVIAPSARSMRSLLQGTWRDHCGSVYRLSLADCDNFDAYKFDVHTMRPDGEELFTKRLIKIEVCHGGVRAFWDSRYLLTRGEECGRLRWAGHIDRDVFEWRRP